MISFFLQREIIINTHKSIDTEYVYKYCELHKFNIITTYNDKKLFQIPFQNELFQKTFRIASKINPLNI